MTALDVDSVRAFVLVADLGSFTKAAQALDTSQAAISVKVKRLEDRLGQRLLDRTSRSVRLSAQGMTFLKPARNFIAAHELAIAGLSTPSRRLVLGISDHIAGPNLSNLLQRLNAYDPALVIEIHIDGSRRLMKAFDKKALDAAIVLRGDNRHDGELLVRERFGWFASAEWKHIDGQPFRLASLSPSCALRGLTVQALDQAGIPWTEVSVGGGVAAIGVAVLAGLAIAAMAYSVAPVGAVDVGSRHDLPRLPEIDVVLHSTLIDPASQGALRTLAAGFRGGNVNSHTGT
jgi:DNA-binding transcriptional LysR family regulator